MMCPESESLVRHAEGGGAFLEREALRAHLRECGECRAELAAAVLALREAETLEGPASPPRPRWAIPALAAAVLILAAVLWREGVSSPPASPSPVVPPSGGSADSPFEPAARGVLQALAGDLEVPFGESGLLTLRMGARAELSSGSILLHEGDLALETRGEDMEIRVAGVEKRARVSEGSILVTRDRSRTSSWRWPSDAWAVEGGWRVVVLSGSALVGQTPVPAGQEMDLSGERTPVPALAPPWRPQWRSLEGLPLRLKDETRFLGTVDVSQDFVWEARVRRSGPVLFDLSWGGSTGWRLPMGQASLGDPGRWIRLRLESRKGWVRVLAGGLEVLTCPVSRLSERAYDHPGTRPGVSLLVFGGDLEVAEVRWR